MVLSADPNKRLPASFSHTFREAGLNQGLPFGSIGVARENHEYDELKVVERSRREEQEKRQDLVAKAARMEALDTATDEILKAAKSLEKEVRRETKYWQEIVGRNVRHAPFGVRFGASEGTSRVNILLNFFLMHLQPAITSKPAVPLHCAWIKTGASSLIQILH
jgi:mediator of RNA polymerase II transcription subunit 17